MMHDMNSPQTLFETLKPEIHGGESWIESPGGHEQIDLAAASTELEDHGCEMGYHDHDPRTPAAVPPKRLSGTVYNWQGSSVRSDTPTGYAAPVIVASQAIARSAPKMSVRTTLFGPAAQFSDLPIAA